MHDDQTLSFEQQILLDYIHKKITIASLNISLVLQQEILELDSQMSSTLSSSM